jgi:hypothetical protein
LFDAGPRPLDPAIHAALHAAVGHGRHIGLAQANCASGTKPFDGERIAISDQVRKRGTSRGGGKPLHQITVFGRIGNAIERPQRFALGPTGIGRLSFLERIGVANHHRVEGGGRVGAVVGIDPGEIGLDQFNRRRLARFERSTQLGNGNLGDLNHAVTAGC